MQIKQYYWWWEKIINEDQIKKINECKPVAGKDTPANVKKTSKVVFIPYKKIKKHLNNAVEYCYHCNANNFYYDLFSFANKNVYHNTYSSKNKAQYDWHVDANDTFTYDIKFTVIINVSEKKYEGGKFMLYNGSKKVYVKQLDNPGSMLMFRSNLLHKVEPVTRGERKTLSIFLLGPDFK
jgi:predicted 2-oxoglutarate/Fe(II)-dependent dioxygenase YbiX